MSQFGIKDKIYKLDLIFKKDTVKKVQWQLLRGELWDTEIQSRPHALESDGLGSNID